MDRWICGSIDVGCQIDVGWIEDEWMDMKVDR